MNVDFSEEQKVLRDQARKFLGERAAPARVRAILETDAPFDRDLWRGMAEMGWMGTAVPEAMGGAGLGSLELCVIAEELRRSLAPTPFSSSVYLATEAIRLAGTAEQQQRWLPKLALGEAIRCLALAEGPRPPRPEAMETRADGGRLSGAKWPVADGDVATFAVVAAREGAGVSLFVVDLAGAGVSRESVTALSRGQTPGPEASIGKLVTASKLQDIAAFGIDLLDMGGAVTDPALAPMRAAFQEAFLYSPGARIAGGTDEILRNILAERVLGLPPDIRVDKDAAFDDVPTGRQGAR